MTEPTETAVTAKNPAAGAVAHTLSDAQIEAMPVWRNFVGLWPESRREIVDAVVDLLAAAPTPPAQQPSPSAAPAWEHHARKLTQWLHCMSHNDSYFGEPAGLVKQVTGELNRLIGAAPQPSPTPQADSVTAPAGGANWQDISTAPKDGTRFVAVGQNYGLDSETQHTCMAQWFRDCWIEVSEWNEISELKYLTHWMPLPPLPGSAARAWLEGKA